jgi:hypothetical protein
VGKSHPHQFLRGPGEFGECLAALLDAIKTRKRWKEDLGVSESALSQWIQEVTIPKRDRLRKIWETALATKDLSNEVLDRFAEMADKPAADVSRHGARFGARVSEYVMQPRLETFWSTFRRLPMRTQEAFLDEIDALLFRYDPTGVTRTEAGSVPAAASDSAERRREVVAAELTSLPDEKSRSAWAATIIELVDGEAESNVPLDRLAQQVVKAMRRKELVLTEGKVDEKTLQDEPENRTLMTQMNNVKAAIRTCLRSAKESTTSL